MVYLKPVALTCITEAILHKLRSPLATLSNNCALLISFVLIGVRLPFIRQSYRWGQFYRVLKGTLSLSFNKITESVARPLSFSYCIV